MAVDSGNKGRTWLSPEDEDEAIVGLWERERRIRRRALAPAIHDLHGSVCVNRIGSSTETLALITSQDIPCTIYEGSGRAHPINL